MQRLTLQHACLYAKVLAAHIWQALFAREPLSRAASEKLCAAACSRAADMLRDVVGGKEPSAEVLLREVAPAVVGAMDEATQARVTEALRVRLDGSPGTLELRYDYEYCSENKKRRLQLL